MGRPPFNWTPEIENEILSRLMAGEALMDICGADRDDFLPGLNTVYKRLADDENFAKQYARARDIQADVEFDETKRIADMATAEDYNVARLRIDARKWRASKMAPKKYGDKLAVDSNIKADINVTASPSDELQRYIDGIAERRGKTS